MSYQHDSWSPANQRITNTALNTRIHRECLQVNHINTNSNIPMSCYSNISELSTLSVSTSQPASSQVEVNIIFTRYSTGSLEYLWFSQMTLRFIRIYITAKAAVHRSSQDVRAIADSNLQTCDMKQVPYWVPTALERPLKLTVITGNVLGEWEMIHFLCNRIICQRSVVPCATCVPQYHIFTNYSAINCTRF
jgi:hypothetical protein